MPWDTFLHFSGVMNIKSTHTESSSGQMVPTFSYDGIPSPAMLTSPFQTHTHTTATSSKQLQNPQFLTHTHTRTRQDKPSAQPEHVLPLLAITTLAGAIPSNARTSIGTSPWAPLYSLSTDMPPPGRGGHITPPRPLLHTLYLRINALPRPMSPYLIWALPSLQTSPRITHSASGPLASWMFLESTSASAPLCLLSHQPSPHGLHPCFRQAFAQQFWEASPDHCIQNKQPPSPLSLPPDFCSISSPALNMILSKYMFIGHVYIIHNSASRRNRVRNMTPGINTYREAEALSLQK